MTNWELIMTLVILLFAIFGATWLSLQPIRKQIIEARFDTIKAQIATLHAELERDSAAHRAGTRHLAEKVDRIDRQMEALYRPVLPGGGK